MQEMLYPDQLSEIERPRQKCALVTDGRFSGGSSGLSIGHVSPEAAEGGAIGLVEDGDIIEFDIPNRRLISRSTTPNLSAAVRQWRRAAIKRGNRVRASGR